MHFVIMGCGRVGATLAKALDGNGHSVAVVDRDPDAFLKLGPDFKGATITGLGFDRETLTQARTADAFAFAAVSSGDNSNILAARVARETFGVPNVAARIYDRQGQVFERLGIPTVPTVRWTAEQVMRKLVPQVDHGVPGALGQPRPRRGPPRPRLGGPTDRGDRRGHRGQGRLRHPPVRGHRRRRRPAHPGRRPRPHHVPVDRLAEIERILDKPVTAREEEE